MNAKSSVLAGLTDVLAKQLGMNARDIDHQRPFLEFGADSVVFVEVVHWIERRYGVNIAPHQLFERLANLDALAAHVARHAVVVTTPAEREEPPCAPAPPAQLRFEHAGIEELI